MSDYRQSDYDYSRNNFLPVTKQEIKQRCWHDVDIVLITGDAYVDHPLFGTAVIGKILEYRGYRVGIIAMPAWKDPAAVTIFGKPRLFFGVTAGNVDSMLARYTAFKRYRSDDPYVPGGKAGCKPERAVQAEADTAGRKAHHSEQRCSISMHH